MNNFTIDAVEIEISESESLQRLFLDGIPTGLFLTGDEARILRRVSSKVHCSVLEVMFGVSPRRLQKLQDLLCH